MSWVARYPARIVAALLFGLSVVCWANGWRLGLDNEVYRAGAQAVLHHEPLYGRLTMPAWVGNLPFIYPPIAAVLFLPLAALPIQLGWGLLAALGTLGVGAVLRAANPARPLLLLIGAFCLEPLWHTIALGQVNLLLMTLVVLDLLVLPESRWRGVLIGLAAAIKLTPLIFVLHLVITGRKAAAGRALATFGLLNLAGLVLLPGDTVRFWTSQVLGGTDAPNNAWGGNQSLNGMIQRLSGQAHWAFALAVLAGLMCLAIALPLAHRLHRRGEALAAVLVTGFCGVLISPISWTHHWVWVIPLFGLLVRQRSRWGLVALGVVFTGWMFQLLPMGGNRELSWTPLQTLLGNSYVLAALIAAPIVWRLAFAPSRIPVAEPVPDR